MDTKINNQTRWDMESDLYWRMTRKQRQKYHKLGGCNVLVAQTSMYVWEQVTKSMELRQALIELKRACIRSV